jgi:hypothetical protein
MSEDNQATGGEDTLLPTIKCLKKISLLHHKTTTSGHTYKKVLSMGRYRMRKTKNKTKHGAEQSRRRRHTTTDLKCVFPKDPTVVESHDLCMDTSAVDRKRERERDCQEEGERTLFRRQGTAALQRCFTHIPCLRRAQ